MPRFLYAPNPKQYNAHILAAAVDLVRRRTRFRPLDIERELGINHTTFYRIQNKSNGVSESKLRVFLIALVDVQEEHATPAMRERVPCVGG